MDSLQEALKVGRTAVWFENQIIGRVEYLEPLFHASIQVSPCHYRYKDNVYCTISNQTDVKLELQRKGKQGPPTISLGSQTTGLLKIRTKSEKKQLTLHYEVTNYLIAPGKSLPVKLVIKLPN